MDLWSVDSGPSALVICETYWVYWCYIDLLSIRGEGGVNLPWVYVHTAICETYLV